MVTFGRNCYVLISNINLTMIFRGTEISSKHKIIQNCKFKFSKFSKFFNISLSRSTNPKDFQKFLKNWEISEKFLRNCEKTCSYNRKHTN